MITTAQYHESNAISTDISRQIGNNQQLNDIAYALFKVFMAGALCTEQTTTPTKKGDDPA